MSWFNHIDTINWWDRIAWVTILEIPYPVLIYCACLKEDGEERTRRKTPSTNRIKPRGTLWGPRRFPLQRPGDGSLLFPVPTTFSLWRDATSPFGCRCCVPADFQLLLSPLWIPRGHFPLFFFRLVLFTCIQTFSAYKTPCSCNERYWSGWRRPLAFHAGDELLVGQRKSSKDRS